jgi:hypothetical protein
MENKNNIGNFLNFLIAAQIKCKKNQNKVKITINIFKK